MRGMRLRIAILLALLVVGGLLSSIAPAQADVPWNSQLQISCEAKGHPGTPVLRYPTVGGLPPGPLASFKILCGKFFNGGHEKHPGSATPTFCVATDESVGKKPIPKVDPTRILGEGNLPSNCLLLVLATALGFCGLSTGLFVGRLHVKDIAGDWKLITFLGEWNTSAGGTLLFDGEALKAGGPPLAVLNGVVNAAPDSEKMDSCVGGADDFKVVGTIDLTSGIDPKS